MNFKIHWLAMTVYWKQEMALKAWELWFEKYLGKLEPLGHGGRGFRQLYQSLGGAKMYCSPVGNDLPETYIHLELPGTACDALPDEVLHEFMVTMRRWEKMNVTRIDLAWDGVAFTPMETRNAVMEGSIRSLLKRRTLKFWEEPLGLKDNGEIGTTSMSVGSRQSERMLRVYDKRGDVRLEFQARQKRANLIADLLLDKPSEWGKEAIKHLRDYLDFEIEGKMLVWWKNFVGETERAGKKITDVRVAEIGRMVDWIMNQVAPTFSTVIDVIGKDMVEEVMVEGRRNRKQRLKALLEIAI